MNSLFSKAIGYMRKNPVLVSRFKKCNHQVRMFIEYSQRIDPDLSSRTPFRVFKRPKVGEYVFKGNKLFILGIDGYSIDIEAEKSGFIANVTEVNKDKNGKLFLSNVEDPLCVISKVNPDFDYIV